METGWVDGWSSVNPNSGNWFLLQMGSSPDRSSNSVHLDSQAASLESWKRFNECSKMTNTNNSVERHEGSNTTLHNDTYLSNFSEHFRLNGSQDDNHQHLYHNYSGLDSSFDNLIFYLLPDDFNWAIYIYFWTLLVILTAVANVLIGAVYVRKSMRTTVNIILLFIAISDSLTGLVTLPTYIHVFTNVKHGLVSLNENWCEAFMISQFYISRSLHTVSKWQTLLLGFQRFCCVWFPLKTKSWFTTRQNLISVAFITICAFVIHSYHLKKKKADKILSLCVWKSENPCVDSCAFRWMMLFLVNILPSGILLVLTILMIQKLFHHDIIKESFSAEQSRMRDQHNKRVSIIVVCIVIIFLIPEIPHGIFLLVFLIKKHRGNNILPLRLIRVLYLTYEILVLLGFHANFWVYIILNRRFRDELKSIFLNIMRNVQPKRLTVPLAAVSMEMRQSQSHVTKGADVNEQSTVV